MNAWKISSLGLLLSLVANAGILEPTLSSKEVSGVKVIASATFADASGKGKASVTTVGAALRSKLKGVLVSVYVGQLLVSDPGKFSRDDAGALGSVAAMPAAAMQLKFLRTVDAPTAVESFANGFKSNGLENDATAKAVLDFVKATGDFEAGKTFTVTALTAAAGKDVVVLESTNGTTTKIEAAGAAKVVFSLWVGTLPKDDSGLLKFKKELISGANL